MSVFVYNKNMEKILPYSDEKMLYNEETKQYELDLGWVKSNFGNPFADDNTLTVRIKRNTRKVYNYIFSHSNSGNRKIITAIINHTEEYRTYIYDALFSEMEADLASGYNDQDKYVPKTKDDRELQHMNQVSVTTQEIIMNSQGYGGINLVSAMVLPYGVFLDFWSYAQ